MDSLYWLFPVSGVKTYFFIPPLVAFVVSFFTSMGGVSGAFLLLPFQVSFLNFTTPAVSATNFVYNIVAIPSGVYRYLKEGRMAWPLTWVVIAGTLPGVFIGYYLRVLYLPDPKAFKFFVGAVLLYLGLRLLYEMTSRSQKGKKGLKALEDKFNQRAKELKENQAGHTASALPAEAVVKTIHFSLSRVEYEFWGERFSFSTLAMFFLACVVGVIGGIYGIGGGAIIAPFCVAVFQSAGLYRGRGRPAGNFFDLHCRGLFLQRHSGQSGNGHGPGLAFGFSLRGRRLCRDVSGRQDSKIRPAKIHQNDAGSYHHLPGLALHHPIFLLR